MPIREAWEIHEQAVKLVNDDPTEKQALRDGAAMLLVALEQAGAPSPETEAELARAYLYLRNEAKSKLCAHRALMADPNSFTAQYVKTMWAGISLPGFFAVQKYKSEMDRLIAIFENRSKVDRSATLFLSRSRTLKTMADVAKDYGISTPRVFHAIAKVPIDHLEYETDDQRVEVQK
jgi:hypothetical protein